jgi:capsular exopolysaccharide synthesis family protein
MSPLGLYGDECYAKASGHKLYKRLIAGAKTSASARESADWLHPPLGQAGLRRFLQTIRERLRLVLLVLVIVLGGAGIYLITAEKVYEAQADILVTPVPTQEPVLSTVGVITQSVDPSLDVETANQLIDSPAVADRAATRLGGGETGDALLSDVSVAPIPESNIVTITASGPSPEAAAARANAFAQAAVVERRQTIASNIDALLPKLRSELASSESEEAATSLSNTIATLSAFRASGNATIQVETRATPPSSPSSPRTVLVLVGALIAGLVLGVGVVFAAQVLDPRLRREEQLRSLFNLPILARIPRERSRAGPLAPERLSPMAREAYRTLRAGVAAASPDERGPQSILVGGSGPSEGKSTTAINLAASLALAGHTVILIDADLRRPAIAKTLDVPARQGVVSVLLGRAQLAEALEPVPAYMDNLRVLVADKTGADFADLFSLPAASRLLEEADQLADYVIIDSPPLSDVVDALQLAQHADAVLIVTRLGHSRITKIRELGEMLAGSGIRPTGFALLGTPRSERKSYAYYDGEADRRSRTKLPLTTR